MDVDAILCGLNDAQREAVTHVEGPLMVVAGAGSGKTRVVTHRIAHLVAKGVWPEQILAMTFTNKAAGAMKERVAQLTDTMPRWTGTFHSVCARLLRRDMDKIEDGRTGDFTIYDTTDQQAVVRACVQELGLERLQLRPADVLACLSRLKCQRLLAPGSDRPEDDADDPILRILKAYEQRLRTVNAVDFDDLLLLVVRLLDTRPDVRDVYLSKFPYVLIDEYQDTNRVQYRLMRLLTGPSRNVHVTGDPDQSIYAWRGADYRNITDFIRDYEDARIVRLEENYRSTQTILAAANELIAHNSDRPEKELYTANAVGEKIKLVCVDDEVAESAWIAQRVVTVRGEGADLRDMAVFYRTNAQSRALEEALIGLSIPYQIVGGTRFYERKEVKDMLAHLRLMVNPRDVVSLERVLGCRATGVGPRTLTRLVAAANAAAEPVLRLLQRDDFAERYGGRPSLRLLQFAGWCGELGALPVAPLSEAVYRALRHSGLLQYYEERGDRDSSAEDRIENLEALVQRAVEFEALHPEATLAQFLSDVALVADVDGWDGSVDCLSLMTLHSAKGLEFPYVFIAGVEQGLLPHQNASSPDQFAEERRLFYVGLTRGEREVAVTFARTRRMWGYDDERIPSCFLDELPEEVVEHTDESVYGPDW